MKIKSCKKLLLICLLSIFNGFLLSCYANKYNSKDGDPVITSSSNLIPDNRILSIPIESLPVIENSCMNTTDFDYQYAGISMESYPKIKVEEYKKYFVRNGRFDFYLHPIVCNGMVYNLKNNFLLEAYELQDGKVRKLWNYNVLNRQERKN